MIKSVRRWTVEWLPIEGGDTAIKEAKPFMILPERDSVGNLNGFWIFTVEDLHGVDVPEKKK